MDIRRRAAGVHDAEVITGLLGQLGYPDQDVAAVADRIHDWARDPGAALVVAEAAGSVVAVMAVVAQRNFHRAEPIAQLVSLVVSDEVRGQGVGRLLVEDAEAFARDRGCGSMQLSSLRDRPEAHAFYRSLGFHDRCETHARYARAVPYGEV